MQQIFLPPALRIAETQPGEVKQLVREDARQLLRPRLQRGVKHDAALAQETPSVHFPALLCFSGQQLAAADLQLRKERDLNWQAPHFG